MTSEDDIDNLEKLLGQLRSHHAEISLLSKKSPTDTINTFKLSIINGTLSFANQILGEKYQPILVFSKFDSDDVPSNSDVILVLSQYIEEAERFRGDNIGQKYENFYYKINGHLSERRAAPPYWSKK